MPVFPQLRGQEAAALGGPPEPLGETIEAPFDQYQRYMITSAVAHAMRDTRARESDARGPRVLDVGGHHTDFWGRPRRPIAEFLPEFQTVTLDVGPNPNAGYVRGRGDALPVREGSFDLVCAVDVLEHVPAAARPTLVNEMTRASSRAVLLAAPFDHPEVERAEKFVTDFIQRTCGYDQGQLREHRERGLPDLAATHREFVRAGWHVRVWPYGNLWRWVLMMIDKHALQAMAGSKRAQVALDRAFNESRFAADREPPCYRHFVVAARSADDPVLAFVESAYGAVSAAAWRDRPPLDPAIAASTFALLEAHGANQRIQVRFEPERQHRQLADVAAHRTRLVAALDAMTAEATRLKDMLRAVERSPAYRVSTWVRRLVGRA